MIKNDDELAKRSERARELREAVAAVRAGRAAGWPGVTQDDEQTESEVDRMTAAMRSELVAIEEQIAYYKALERVRAMALAAAGSSYVTIELGDLRMVLSALEVAMLPLQVVEAAPLTPRTLAAEVEAMAGMLGARFELRESTGSQAGLAGAKYYWAEHAGPVPSTVDEALRQLAYGDRAVIDRDALISYVHYACADGDPQEALRSFMRSLPSSDPTAEKGPVEIALAALDVAIDAHGGTVEIAVAADALADVIRDRMREVSVWALAWRDAVREHARYDWAAMPELLDAVTTLAAVGKRREAIDRVLAAWLKFTKADAEQRVSFLRSVTASEQLGVVRAVALRDLMRGQLVRPGDISIARDGERIGAELAAERIIKRARAEGVIAPEEQGYVFRHRVTGKSFHVPAQPVTLITNVADAPEGAARIGDYDGYGAVPDLLGRPRDPRGLGGDVSLVGSPGSGPILNGKPVAPWCPKCDKQPDRWSAGSVADAAKARWSEITRWSVTCHGSTRTADIRDGDDQALAAFLRPAEWPACPHPAEKRYGDHEYGTTFCGLCHADVTELQAREHRDIKPENLERQGTAVAATVTRDEAWALLAELGHDAGTIETILGDARERLSTGHPGERVRVILAAFVAGQAAGNAAPQAPPCDTRNDQLPRPWSRERAVLRLIGVDVPGARPHASGCNCDACRAVASPTELARLDTELTTQPKGSFMGRGMVDPHGVLAQDLTRVHLNSPEERASEARALADYNEGLADLDADQREQLDDQAADADRDDVEASRS